MRTITKRAAIIYCLIALLTNSLFGQDTIPAKAPFKPHIELYPSANVMYGAGFYRLMTSSSRSPETKYYNQNINIGVNFNADLVIKSDISLQFYIGYNRWPQANLFPIGLMVKPKLNKKTNEFYLKLGGGFTLGKRYDDVNEPWLVSSMPKDYGNGSMHFQGGFEKYWHFSTGQAISLGFLLNIQYIKSYYSESYNTLGKRTTQSYFLSYKFAGITIAYHFY